MARLIRWQTIARLDIIILTGTIWFLAKFLRYAFPPLFPRIQLTYGVSNTILGAAFTMMMIVYAATQFPAGALADRVGAVPVIGAGGLIASAAALLIAGVDHFGVLLIGMVGVGLGTGVHKTVTIRLLSSVYPDRTGRALGVLDTAGTAGGVVAPATIVALGTAWRGLFTGAGLVGIILVALFLKRVWGRRSTRSRHDGSIDWQAYLALTTRPRVAAFIGVTVFFSFTYNGVVAFLPLYLIDAAGLSSAVASTLFAGLFAVSMVQLVSGDISDRIGQLPVIGVALTLALLGLVSVMILRGPIALAGAVVVFGIGSHGFRPVRGAYLVSILPDKIAGGGLGAARAVLMGAGAIAPAVIGVVSDTAGFGVAFGLLGLVLGGAVAITGWLLIGSKNQNPVAQ